MVEEEGQEEEKDGRKGGAQLEGRRGRKEKWKGQGDGKGVRRGGEGEGNTAG